MEGPAGGVVDRIAWRSGEHQPATVAAWIAFAGLVVMSAIILGLGLLLTHVFLHGAIGRWDERVNEWFVTQRTMTLNSVTSIATTIGSTGPVLAVGFASVILLAMRRLWPEIGIIVVALSVEVLVFLMTTIVVNRPRPTVPRLDPSPPTSSFPSGHTAAAIALWVSLAIILSPHVRNALLSTIVWIVAIGLPIFVGISRLYRGMHHPTDVMAGVLLGAGAVATAVLAVRAAARVAEIRRRSPTVVTSKDDTSVEVAS